MNALILMTRIPYGGQTKTRLMPILSPENCQTLHQAFLEDYYTCFDKLDVACDIFVAYAPENFTGAFLNTIPHAYGAFVQSGDNIGERMYRAFETLFDRGYDKIVLAGCDIPHIQPQTYESAFAQLEKKDMVICPTYDGGYCLIGLKHNHKALFMSDVNWGNQSVVERTFAVANQLNLDVAMLEKYRDIDLFEDLMILRDQFGKDGVSYSHVPENTLDYLEKLIEKMVI